MTSFSQKRLARVSQQNSKAWWTLQSRSLRPVCLINTCQCICKQGSPSEPMWLLTRWCFE